MSPDLPFDVPKCDNPRIDGVSYMQTSSDGASRTMHFQRDPESKKWMRLDETGEWVPLKIMDGVYKASISSDFRWEPMPDGTSDDCLTRPIVAPVGSAAQRLADHIISLRKKNHKFHFKPLGPEFSPESQPIDAQEYFRRIRQWLWLDPQQGDGETIVRSVN